LGHKAVDLRVEPHGVVLTFEDEGVAFDPLQAPLDSCAKRAARIRPELMLQSNAWTFDEALVDLTTRTPRWRKRCSLPVSVLGNAATKAMCRGYLYGAIVALTWSCSVRASVPSPVTPGANTTNAFTACPRS
jgi:hypothetical protein